MWVSPHLMLIDFNGLNLFGYTEICVEIKPTGLLMSHKAPPHLSLFIFTYLFIFGDRVST